MSDKSVKQFKLNNGEEIVCEILEYADDDYYDLLIRRAFEIKCIMGPDYTRYYAMKPWMTVSEGKDNFISLNTASIIGEVNPSKPVMEHYRNAVRESEMSNEEIARKMMDQVKKYEKGIDSEEKTSTNIIDFPGKKPTLH
jgi:hypothetical protein